MIRCAVDNPPVLFLVSCFFSKSWISTQKLPCCPSSRTIRNYSGTLAYQILLLERTSVHFPKNKLEMVQSGQSIMQSQINAIQFIAVINRETRGKGRNDKRPFSLSTGIFRMNEQRSLFSVFLFLCQLKRLTKAIG